MWVFGVAQGHILMYNPCVPDILNAVFGAHYDAKRAPVSGKLCPSYSKPQSVAEMIGEKELTKRLTACIQTAGQIAPFQMVMANQIVRRIVPMVLAIIKEEVRAARRENSVET